MKHLRTVFDLASPDTLHGVLRRAQVLKRQRTERRLAPTLSGRVVGMLFELPSTRTRASFESGIALLGGSAVVLHGRDTQLATQMAGGEPMRDAARVLGSYVDAIVARCSSHAALLELARHAGVPVINGQSEADHPCQVLTDAFTVFERREKPFALRWTYVGDREGTVNGLVALAAITGIQLALALPKDAALQARVRALAKEHGAKVELFDDVIAAVRGAQVLRTDAWTTAGSNPNPADARVAELLRLQVNAALLAHCADDCVVLHPLPARRGLEITDDVLEGQHSVAFQQASNRLCVQQALLETALGVLPAT